MTKTLYNQTTPASNSQLPGRDQPKDAAKKSIDRVGKALDRVFEEARARA